MKILAKFWVASGMTLSVLMFASQALALEAPDAMIERVSKEVIEIAKRDKEIQGRNFIRIVALVEEKILPHLDMERATALTVGHHWRSASPEQRQQLTVHFRDLLIYTYAGAIAQIKDQTPEFKPLRADPGDTEVEVRYQVRLPRRAEPIQVGYRLWKSPEGWKIFDVNVLGAWLSESYRSSFSSEINRGGIDGLIGTLAEKNQNLAASIDSS
jgi:phospholipid transport system substrate-binding protein